MLKRIIFDIDNTLIKVPKTCDFAFQAILNKYNVNKTGRQLYQLVGKYEYITNNEYYKKDKLLKMINDDLKTKLPMKFLDECIDIYNNLDVDLCDDIYSTLEYLSLKYELVCLSNWFTDSQKARLKKVDILKYFDNVYGADIVPLKPIKKSYLSVLGNHQINECMMVGDSIKFDIEIPYEMGMQVCYINDKKHDKYLTIDKISKLKEML